MDMTVCSANGSRAAGSAAKRLPRRGRERSERAAGPSLCNTHLPDGRLVRRLGQDAGCLILTRN